MTPPAPPRAAGEVGGRTVGETLEQIRITLAATNAVLRKCIVLIREANAEMQKTLKNHRAWEANRHGDNDLEELPDEFFFDADGNWLGIEAAYARAATPTQTTETRHDR